MIAFERLKVLHCIPGGLFDAVYSQHKNILIIGLSGSHDWRAFRGRSPPLVQQNKGNNIDPFILYILVYILYTYTTQLYYEWAALFFFFLN